METAFQRRRINARIDTRPARERKRLFRDSLAKSEGQRCIIEEIRHDVHRYYAVLFIPG